MKRSILLITALAAFTAFQARAATPEQEKAFVDSYRKALEAKDEKALAGFLYTQGADAETIDFFKMMQAIDPGAKIVSIELVKPTAAEEAKFNEPMVMPDGKKYKLPLKPFKRLVVKTEIKDATGSGSSSSGSPVAEKGGKLVIPVPVPVK
jgi:hypothetical protein